MVKSSFAIKLITLAITTTASLLPMQVTRANTVFDEVEVVQKDFIAVGQSLPPLFGIPRYNLLVIEQIPGRNTCWEEMGEKPTNVNLLLGNFDFSGHCRRATDANGYSIRYNGEDYGQSYILTFMKRDEVLHLVGVNRETNNVVEIGTTTGVNDQPLKINLNPGWQFTKRSYQGKVLGHVYFSYQDPTPQGDNTNDDTLPEGNIREIIAPNN